MNRREFSKSGLILGMGFVAGSASGGLARSEDPSADYYEEPAKKLPARKFDVVVAGGGTAGVLAATAAARQEAKTALIEMKGYPGGTATEGGTTLPVSSISGNLFPESKSARSSGESPTKSWNVWIRSAAGPDSAT